MNLEVFTNDKFGEIRIATVDGEPWFAAADVCTALNLTNPSKAVSRLDDDEKNTLTTSYGIAGNPNLTFVSEAGLYNLIFTSRKDEAKLFKRWVTHEVLPAIRKTGRYETAPRFEIPQTYREALEAHLRELKAREAVECYARELEPKAEFYDKIMSTDGTYTIGAVAKLIGWSQNRLFNELRARGVLIGKGHMRNTPYQRFMKYFQVKAYEYERQDGTHGASYTTVVLPTGVEWVARRVGATLLNLDIGASGTS